MISNACVSDRHFDCRLIECACPCHEPVSPPTGPAFIVGAQCARSALGMGPHSVGNPPLRDPLDRKDGEEGCQSL